MARFERATPRPPDVYSNLAELHPDLLDCKNTHLYTILQGHLLKIKFYSLSKGNVSTKIHYAGLSSHIRFLGIGAGFTASSCVFLPVLPQQKGHSYNHQQHNLSIRGPTRVAGSSGLPIFFSICWYAIINLSTTESYIFSSIISLRVEVQRCPVVPTAPKTMAGTASFNTEQLSTKRK